MRTLVAIAAIAKPAADPDRHPVTPILEIHAIGIDDVARMADAAPDLNREMAARRVVAGAGLGDSAGN
jgi:hypothetical protein